MDWLLDDQLGDHLGLAFQLQWLSSFNGFEELARVAGTQCHVA